MIKQTHYITACNTCEWLVAMGAPSSGGIYSAENVTFSFEEYVLLPLW